MAPSAEFTLEQIRRLLSGNLSIGSTVDPLIEVQKGNVPGHSMVHKFGRNDVVPMDAWAFVDQLALTTWPLSAATTVRVKAGGNGADIAGGDGAREVTVRGIDSNFNEISEAIVTAGANASAATSASFWRIHRAWVSAAGVYGAANTAAVTIENSGGGTDLIQISIEEGQTQFAAWTVPIGKTAYLLSLHISVDSKKIANIRVFTREQIDVTVAPVLSKRLKLHYDGIAGMIMYKPQGPELVIPAKTDIWVEAFGDGAVCEVSVDFELLVVDD